MAKTTSCLIYLICIFNKYFKSPHYGLPKKMPFHIEFTESWYLFINANQLFSSWKTMKQFLAKIAMQHHRIGKHPDYGERFQTENKKSPYLFFHWRVKTIPVNFAHFKH